MSKSTIPLLPNKMYHIWNHANGNENLFRTTNNYNYFLEKYIYYIHPISDTFAYCLMPNHFHFMVRIKSEDDILKHINEIKTDLSGFKNLTGLSPDRDSHKSKQNLSGTISKQFSNLFNSYTKSFNKAFDRKGSLFKRPFSRKLINSKSYYTRLIAYIHNNPIHHGFVGHPEDWPFSSWHAYGLNKETKINKQEAVNWLNNSFEKIHKETNHQDYISLFE